MAQEQKIGDLGSSFIRTLEPMTVGLVTALLIRHGVHLDATATALLSQMVAGGFYVGVRLVEHYVSPKFGWLLGLAKPPAYVEPPAVITDASGTRAVVPPAVETDVDKIPEGVDDAGLVDEEPPN